jgi:hypothetical protein
VADATLTTTNWKLPPVASASFSAWWCRDEGTKRACFAPALAVLLELAPGVIAAEVSGTTVIVTSQGRKYSAMAAPVVPSSFKHDAGCWLPAPAPAPVCALPQAMK